MLIEKVQTPKNKQSKQQLTEKLIEVSYNSIQQTFTIKKVNTKGIETADRTRISHVKRSISIQLYLD